MTPIVTDDEHIDLVREADLDWHAGFTVGEEVNRYSTLIGIVERAVLERMGEPVLWMNSAGNVVAHATRQRWLQAHPTSFNADRARDFCTPLHALPQPPKETT